LACASQLWPINQISYALIPPLSWNSSHGHDLPWQSQALKGKNQFHCCFWTKKGYL